MSHNYRYSSKKCSVCENLFQPRASVHSFCSNKCKYLYESQEGYRTTENQYKRINYNWRKYLQKLIYQRNREKLSLDYLLNLIEKQEYKCALSGHKMTCILEKGKINLTNASIDRIIPGAEYVEGNIRFVCRIANIMKWNMHDSELRDWCKRILDFGT